MQQTKRHHYVPKAYLKTFCDDQGKLHVYRKDAPTKPFAELLAEADDFDGPSYHGRGPRSNVVWWDGVVVPMLQRRRRLALAGRVLMRKSVHEEMRLRDLLAKAHAAATARQPVLVVRRSRPNGQQPTLVPTDEELRAAACRRARLALS